ncbi:MAG: OmpH family outer membrane protein [Bacteroidia bacterium]
MKNLSMALNAILIVAVGFLYYKVYAGNTPKSSTANSVTVSAKSSNIFYVNADTLFDKYELYKSNKERLEKKEDSIKSFLQSRSEALQSEAAQYQQQAQGMTDAQRQQTEAGLMKKQESLVALKDNLLGNLEKEQIVLNDSINDHMQAYIKEFVKGKNITYIVGYHRTGEVLYANDSLNITNQLLEGLNKK